MQYCSLCSREYDDIIKQCNLSHCTSCGSTTINSEKITKYNPISLIVIVGFLVLVTITIVQNMQTYLYFIVPAMAVFVSMAIRDSTVSRTRYHCIDCNTSGSVPLTNVQLQPTRKPRLFGRGITDNVVTAGSISNAHITQQQEKFSIRNILMIISLGIAVIGMIFGPLIHKAIESYFIKP